MVKALLLVKGRIRVKTTPPPPLFLGDLRPVIAVRIIREGRNSYSAKCHAS